ncbi:hypothetical protein VSDG_05680 [Cytospora chrysosperma]|uniref:Uncharacterized protein n=1 Tax=Cytospora chrysosperma TaxID=252740 RepID=A0A423VT52_CYTCH|nr:hypothetical protein VSDG_05680 [Valsa sordida]
MHKFVDIDPLLMEADVPQVKGASIFKKATLYLGRLWVETCNDLRYDLKPTRSWRAAARNFAWLIFTIWAMGTILFCFFFPLGLMRAVSWKDSFYDWNYCAPDGSFSLEPTNPWKPAWTFQITLGFGSLSFTQAKAIDIVWDVVVGRFGQTVLAYFSWISFSAYVRVSMEHAPITYRTFWTYFMQSEASFRATVRMIRDFTSRRGLGSRIAMVFMISTMIFVMAFPTLASAMTGYTAKTEAVIKLVNISQYGVRNNTPSNWTQISDHGYANPDPIELQSPTLDITIYDGKVNNKSFIYTPSNTTYTLPYIEENSVCQPATVNFQQTYQWGFSVLQLEVTLVLLTIWTFGTWYMWLDAHLSLTNRGKFEIPHGIKAVLYLADSIRNDFNDLGEEPGLFTDEELRKHAAEHLRGGKVMIQVSESQVDLSLRWGSWHWLKTNKLWASAFLIAIASSWWFCGNFVVVSTMGLATAANWKRKTRTVVAWAAFIVGIPVSLLVMSPGVFMLAMNSYV